MVLDLLGKELESKELGLVFLRELKAALVPSLLVLDMELWDLCRKLSLTLLLLCPELKRWNETLIHMFRSCQVHDQ